MQHRESTPTERATTRRLLPRVAAPSHGPARSGRAAEFRVIYDAHFKVVWRALGRLGVREPDLMDLAQKVFLTAYLKLPEFEGRSLLSTWLWGICRRVASSYRRSGAIRYEVATDPAALEISAEQRGGVTSERESAHQVAVESILWKLSEPQRVVFLLFEVDELDGREIAALLDISLGTVRSRLRYARKLFRHEVRRLAIVNAFPKPAAPRNAALERSAP